MHEMPEPDWKRFRKVRENALQTFSRRVLDELHSRVGTPADDYHKSYLSIFKLIQDRDEEMGLIFNNPWRSDAIRQLTHMKRVGLVEPADLEAFSRETRDLVTRFLHG